MKHSVPKKIVLIGASTGGPGQIQKIVNALPKLHDTTVVIAQHMVEGFMNSFAQRLQNRQHNSVRVVHDKQPLESAMIYVCEHDIKVGRVGRQIEFTKKRNSSHAFNPNINELFNSFLPFASEFEIICIILTGIGEDGVAACKALSHNGAFCITESSTSAIVDGMPHRARLEVANIQVNEISEIVDIVKEFCE